jgi:hypothetical protein
MTVVKEVTYMKSGMKLDHESVLKTCVTYSLNVNNY